MKKLSLVFVLLLAGYALTFAQDTQVKEEAPPVDKRWEIGINAGVANFTGNTNISKQSFGNHFKQFDSDLNFGYGFFIRKNFTSVFALEGAYNGTNLTGTPKAGFNYKAFSSGINEFSLNTVWNMNNLFSKNKFDRKIYWYTKLGAGITHVNQKEFTLPETVQTEWRGWTVPIGTGLVFRLTDNLKLDVGTQYSYVNSNNVDGVMQWGDAVGDYPGYLIGQIRESYLYTHAGLTFSLGKKAEKPAPVVEAPKPQPKPEPKPEPKPTPPPPPPPAKVTPAIVGQIFKVYFAYDKWDLNAASVTELDRLAREMQANPSVNLEMKSHTDSRGPASYNMKLSEKRGKSVLDYLTSKGISASRINAQALGESQLVNNCKDGVNCSEAEHKLNRRTETLVIE